MHAKTITRKIFPPRKRRRLAFYCTLLLALLETWLLLTLHFTTTSPPLRLHLFELLWALTHRPAFYPLVALILAAPPLVLTNLRTRPVLPAYHPLNHRTLLLLSALCFLTLLIIYFPHRIALMLRIVAGQYLAG